MAAGLFDRAWFLAGPTAVGKSAVALELARQIGGELVSVDSMQVYRDLDLGTAKPSAAERAAVPHHLLDVCGLTQPFDAAQFVRLARQVAEEIRERGRTPIFCGGTGLYFRALREGLDPLPPADPALRAALAALPLETLAAELRKHDPALAARTDLCNPRRVIRALEILRLGGRRPAERAAAASAAALPPLWVLRRTPEDLRARIGRRVEAMFAAGLVGETRRLRVAGLDRAPTARQALGYRQVLEHLDGIRDLPATVALVKLRTWQYARRQMTWFRSAAGVRWLDLEAAETPVLTAGRLRAAAARAVRA